MESQPINKAGLRSFGLITGAIFVVLFGLLFPFILKRAIPIWPWVVAGVLWFCALAFPNSLRMVYVGWMKVGNVLGWINTRIILGAMYYLIMTPMSVVMRVLGYDPMAKNFNEKLITYRRVKEVLPKKHFERPY